MTCPCRSVVRVPLRPRVLLAAGCALVGLLLLLLHARSEAAPAADEPAAKTRLTLPPDAAFVVHLRVPQLLEHPLPADVYQMLFRSFEFERDTSIADMPIPGGRFSDLEEIAFYYGERVSLNVFTFKKKIIRERVLEQVLHGGAKEVTYKGKKYHSTLESWRGKKKDKGGKDDDKKGPSDEDILFSESVFFPDERTFVMGEGQHIRRYLTYARAADGKHPHRDIAEKLGKHDITISLVMPEEMREEGRDSFRRMQRWEPAFGLVNYNFRPFAEIQSGWLTLDLGEQTKLEANITFVDARWTQRGQDAVKLVLEMAAGTLNTLDSEVLELLSDPRGESQCARYLDQLRAALRQAKMEVKGTTVSVSLQLPTGLATYRKAKDELAPAIKRGEDRDKAEERFQRVARAFQRFNRDQEKMPMPALTSIDGRPLHSWRVQLLPYVGQKELYEKLRLHEPWDSEHNKPLLAEMPDVFALPGVKAGMGMTYMQLFDITLGGKKGGASLKASYPDGLENTLLIFEAKDAVHWAAPTVLEYSDKLAVRKLLGDHYGRGTLAASLDRQVRWIPATMTETDLRAAITPAGNDRPSGAWKAGDRDEDRSRLFGSRRRYYRDKYDDEDFDFKDKK